MKNPELRFVCPEDQLIRLSTVLQSGFHVKGREGDSIFSLLKTLSGFTETYIVDKVQTVFLNGDALDDMETVLRGTAATIALAGAMPGLAGAIVRKGSPWGALRKTRTVNEADYSGTPVDVLIKLFSTVAVDKGPELFTTGVLINTRDLIHFLELRPTLLSSFKDITLNANPLSAHNLTQTVSAYGQLQVQVQRS